VGTRIAATPVLIPITGLMLLTLLALTAGIAAGQSGSRGSTPPDTSGGFRVRTVVTEGKTVRTEEERQREIAEKAHKAAKAQVPQPPNPPGGADAPDVPEPPDFEYDYDSGDNAIVRFGEDITISADKVIDGDVVAIGGDVIVYGRVKGDCVSVGGTVDVRGNGVVEGDAVSMGGGVSTSDSGTVSV
jgi:hypothetical protein